MSTPKDILDNLIVYRASAGAGKTYRLTLEYLTLLFEGIDRTKEVKYDSILVVTFTNKATVELRERILSKLYDLSRGGGDMKSALLTALWGERAVGDREKEDKLRNYATQALRAILEDYTYFRVMTIDSFFQEVVRSFVLEIDRLHSGFEVEIDKATIVALSLEEMLLDLTYQKEHSDTQEAIRNLYNAKAEEDERVRLVSELGRMMSRFFDDPLNPEVRRNAEIYLSPERMEKATRQLEAIRDEITSFVLSVAKEVRSYLEKLHALSETILEDSSYRTLLLQYNKLKGDDREIIERWKKGESGLIGGYIPQRLEATESNPMAWFAKAKQKNKDYEEIITRENGSLRAHLLRLVSVTQDDRLRRHLLSSSLMLKYLRWIPTLILVQDKLDDFQKENGIVLISEVNTLLSDIIHNSDTPFIYDKVGTHIEHYLIDEFQDTNATQWQNFLPLLSESLANGHRNYIVGDVKQSIYRFRGGDSELLGEVLPMAKGGDNSILSLSDNYRSQKEIMDFNNAFFSGIYDFRGFARGKYGDTTRKENSCYPELVADLGDNDAHRRIYSHEGVHQTQPSDSKKSGGYVSVSKKDFGVEELRRLLALLREKGYAPGEIAILVRKNSEATMVTDMLNQLSDEAEEQDKDHFGFISGSALLISNAPTVQLITSYIHLLAHPADRSAKDLFEITLYNLIPVTSDSSSPSKKELYDQIRGHLVTISLKGLSLYELANATIDLVKEIRQIPVEEMVYINAFLDRIFDFTGRYPATYGSFDEWWQSKKEKLYVEMSPTSVNAIQVHTIHNVKGLEFPVVILPFANWAIVHSNSNKSIKLYDFEEEVSSEIKAEVSSLPVLSHSHKSLTYPQDIPYYYFPESPTPQTTNSLFMKALAEELEASYMDALNLLYVAFTRPSERLYVYTGVEKGNYTGALIRSRVQEVWGIIHDDDVEDDILYTSGREDAIHDRGDKREGDDEMITTLSASPRYKDLMIREDKFRSAAIDRGEELHSVMERVKTTDDVDRIVREKKETYREELDRFKRAISTPGSREEFFFRPGSGWEVLTEKAMYSPRSRRTLRTDRLLLNRHTKEAVVVDYKFGHEEARHHRQVQLYLSTLKEMGYRARGFLWYDFTTLIEVSGIKQ